MNEKIILASKSPRRSEILTNVGIAHEIIVSNAPEEDVSSENVPIDIYVQELALLKVSAVKKEVTKRDKIIIGADTIVYLDGSILGKPKSKDDACEMLSRLSGKTHQVLSGICAMRTDDGFSVCESEKTDVTFRELTDEEIYNYVNTGEPMDKAGAYGIQGLGSLFVEKIVGDYYNVMGLPICRLSQLLKREFGYIIKM